MQRLAGMAGVDIYELIFTCLKIWQYHVYLSIALVRSRGMKISVMGDR